MLNQSVLDFSEFVNKIEIQDNHNYCRIDFNVLMTTVPTDTELGKKLRKSQNPNETLEEFLSKTEGYAIYTDGSKNNHSPSVGSACYCPALNKMVKKSINIHASVFTAECMALSDAFEIALESNIKNALIFSDSLSAIQSLNSTKSYIKTNPYILKIKENYRRFISRNTNEYSIKLYWIPSHTGIIGNEEVDRAAKSACESDSNYVNSIPFTDAFEYHKKNAMLQTSKIIKEQGTAKGKTYFRLYFKENSSPWYTQSKLNREVIVSINRMRADHYNLAASLSRIGIINSSRCSCNEEDEDLNHVVWQCKQYDAQRFNLTKKLHSIKLQLPLSIETLISEPNVKACLYIHEFFNECNLRI